MGQKIFKSLISKFSFAGLAYEPDYDIEKVQTSDWSGLHFDL